MRRQSLSALIGLASLALATSASPALSATLLDVDFSTNPSLAGWTLSPGAVLGNWLYLDQGNVSDSYTAAPPIAVIPGSQYMLTFGVATQGGCFFSGDCAGPHNYEMYENGLGSTLLQIEPNPGDFTTFIDERKPPAINRSATESDFTHWTITFLADAPTINLVIFDTTHYPYNLGGIGLVDEFVLTGASPHPAGVPEPSTLALIGAALSACAFPLTRLRTVKEKGGTRSANNLANRLSGTSFSAEKT